MLKRIVLLFIVIASAVKLTANSIWVSNAVELKQANEKAKPGDTIILRNGNWENISLEATSSGTSQQPIVFKAETNGLVTLTKQSSLHIGGAWIVVEGLSFIDGYTASGSVWEFKIGKQVANNCRITNCLIKSFNNPNRMKENYWVAFYGKNNRIDHNSFIDKTNLGVLLAVILDDDRSRLNNHSIDNNYFGERRPLGSNGGEIIRVGVSEHCTFYSNTFIQDNFFEKCDGETEIISIKSCGNIVRRNIFEKCQGAVVLRHGNNNTVESNLFQGNNKMGTGGVRIINEGNWVVNNLFEKCIGEGFRAPLTIMNGVFNSPPNRYLPVRDALIANNSFINCSPFALCEGSDTERTVAPKNVYIIRNLIRSEKKQPPFYASDKIDSIFFFNNSSALSANEVNKSRTIPDSIINQSLQRLGRKLSNNIGVYSTTFFEELYKQRLDKGIQWKQKNTTSLSTKNTPQLICKDATEIYSALARNIPAHNLLLTGANYNFTKPIKVIGKLTISSANKLVLFSSSTNLNMLFEMSGEASLSLSNCIINASNLKANNFIQADGSGTVSHYNFSFVQSSITAFKGVFLYTQKTSYADHIEIKQSHFTNIEGNIFDLWEETDKKGYYNVENLRIEQCSFKNGNGAILQIARTGNDESTMGPKISFIANSISNYNHTNPLIHLFGVQLSVFNNNIFSNSNTNSYTIYYDDSVRAKHLQAKNQLIKSGVIKENIFTINK